jgi:PHD/YefM family antitoxin component YafN of YafNO toxin-antitoxin module
MRDVFATEFARDFPQFCEISQREPLAVKAHGRPAGYFIPAIEFEELKRPKSYLRRSRAVADLSEEEIDEMTATRMPAEHDNLNALLVA